MTRFVGVKHNRVCVVSSIEIVDKDFFIIKVSDDLKNVSDKELIANSLIQNNQLIYKKQKQSAKDLKIAFISNYGGECGIATYSKFLYDELIPLIKDYKIFAEKNNKLKNTDKIIQCWTRGEPLTELVNEIKKYNPDIISIQHEWGIFPNARYWLSLMTQLSDYKIIATMHSVFPNHKDKIIVEASIPNIIVHLDEAKNALKNLKQVSSNIFAVPHGCFPCVDKSKLWNLYKSNHTVISSGFLLRYKSFEIVIKAINILKDKYSDIFLTILGSTNENSKNENQIYFNELYQLIDKLGLQNNVAIIKGFQSDEVLNSYLRCNSVAVFPYHQETEHICYGASGSAPLVMSKNIPVITSNGFHFSTLPSIKADTPEEIASKIDLLFNDKKLVADQLMAQAKYLEINSWKNTAKKYVEIFENCI